MSDLNLKVDDTLFQQDCRQFSGAQEMRAAGEWAYRRLGDYLADHATLKAALTQALRQPAETALPCAACGAEAGTAHGIWCNQPFQIYQEGGDATFQPEKLPTTCNEPGRTDDAPAGRDFEIPRRAQMQLWTPAEKAIFDAMQVVERSGASVALTDAVTFLQQARERVADHVEGINRDVFLSDKIDETVSISTQNLSAKDQD